MEQADSPNGDEPAYESLTDGDLISNEMAATEDQDEFEHFQVAERLAQLLVSLTDSANIALFGPWGSGKSSIRPLLEQNLKAMESDLIVIPYDSWRYSGTSLKRSFIVNAAKGLKYKPSKIHGALYENSAAARVPVVPTLKRIGWVFAFAVFAILVGGFYYGISGDKGFNSDFMHGLRSVRRWAVPALIAVIAAVPFLELVKVTVTRSAPQDDEEFVEVLDKVLKKAKGKRVAFFIDELDRCAPSEVLKTLVGIKTFLERDNCVFIVAADRDVLVEALDASEDNDGMQATPLREYEPYYSTAGAFLDKMFQHQIELPPLRKHTLGKYARTLATEKKGGLWEDLANDGRLGRVTYALIPAHVRSPRRVKVLMNNFAINARIAESRHIEWFDLAEEIAKLTVLRTEFPKFAQHLLLEPRLVDALEDPANSDQWTANRTERFKSLLAHYKNHAADEIIADQNDETGPKKIGNGAEQTLVSQLHAYLGKTAYAKISGPSRSLLHMEPAGTREGLTDPELSEVIDEASEHPPIETASKFEDSEDAKIAAEILAKEYEEHDGPGLTAVVETVCRLAEIMNDYDLELAIPTIVTDTLDQVERATDSPGMMVGAFKIATASNSTNNLGGVLRKFIMYAGDPDNNESLRIDEIAALTHRFSPSQLRDFGNALLLIAEEGRDVPLLTVLRSVPDKQFDPLWNQTSHGLFQHLGSVDANPELLIPQYSEILAVLKERRETGGTQHIAALTASLMSRPGDTYPMVHDEAQEIDTPVADTSASELAVKGMTLGPKGDWEMWLTFLVENVADDLKVAALEHAISEIDINNSDDIALLARMVDGFLELGNFGDQANGEHVAGKLSARMNDVVWSTDFSGANLHHEIDVLLKRLAPESDAVVTDLRNNQIQQVSSAEQPPELTIDVVKYLNDLEREDLGALDEHLTSVHGEHPNSIHALRVHTKIRLGAESTIPFPAAALLDKTNNAALESAVELWIMTQPPFEDVRAVLDQFNFKPTALTKYSEQVKTLAERVVVWRYARDNDFDANIIKAIAAPGLPYSAVKSSFERAQAMKKSSQPKRDIAIDELLALPLASSELLERSSTLIEYLLDKGFIGDKKNAVRIADKIKRPEDGYYVRIRSKFSANRSVFNKGEKAILVNLSLITQEKKPRRRKSIGEQASEVFSKLTRL